MNYRELFNEIMFYGNFDCMPVVHWDGWPETLERWFNEGLPREGNHHDFFKTVPIYAPACPFDRLGLYPLFENEVFEETGEYKVYRNGGGVICKEWKGKSSIPHSIDFTFKSAKDWDIYKKRLQPDPGRLPLPEELDRYIENAEKSGLPIAMPVASLMGLLRDWMGVENMCFLTYENPDVYSDIVMTMTDLSCWAIDQVVPRMKIKPVLGWGWEDICGRCGPFVSPAVFETCVAPGYRKIRQKLEEHGIHLLVVDSDGDGSALVGPWLEAGVNVQFPLEVGTWKADAVQYRKKYGKELRFIGNFNKLSLEHGHADVEAEIQRLMPLMKEGGFIILPDHLITPGVALKDYLWYLDKIRDIRL
jgi:hypothetical protein